MTEQEERVKLFTDFYAAKTIRQRIVIRRHMVDRGYLDLSSRLLRDLVPAGTD